jgi:hypothetical protein
VSVVIPVEKKTSSLTFCPKEGWGGYPTTIYALTFTLPLGTTASLPEKREEGAETQNLAHTIDGGASWIKLNFGANLSL